MTGLNVRRGATPLIILAAGIALVFPRAALAQCAPGCAPQTWGSPSHMRYYITYKQGVFPTQQQETDVDQFVSLAATNWTEDFEKRNNVGSVKKRDGAPQTGDIRIIVTDNISGDRATYDRFTKVMEISKDYLNQFDWAYKIAAVMHEFGHALGFIGADCPNSSVMSPTTHDNYRTYFTDCDRATFTSLFGARQDEQDLDLDDDGWNDDVDCAPDNPAVPNDMSCEEALCEDGMIYVESTGVCTWGSPIVIPLGTSADLRLSSVADGVRFDLDGDGVVESVSWIARDTSAAWLVLDRNGNGQIDSGVELFGNFSPQPTSGDQNGFNALAVFDASATGGNSDGWITAADAIFASLQLWQDTNHDGISQQNELSPLTESLVSGIALSYQLSWHRDRDGNIFRYRAKIEGPRSPWAYDVLLRVKKDVRGNFASSVVSRLGRVTPQLVSSTVRRQEREEGWDAPVCSVATIPKNH